VAKAKSVSDNQSIYDLMFAAIANRKLPPGLKLSEERLCRVFGVSRTRLREVFFRLAQDRIITLKHNRGAYVTRPTARDAIEVFAARRAIEVSVVEQLAASASPQVLGRLQQHLDEEASARADKDHSRLTQLTGDFHGLLAELTGNTIFSDIVRRLTALSSLIICLYDSPSASACKDDEHGEIVQAIASGDASKARALMLEHLEHVEKSLKIDDEEQDDFDIESVFTDMLKN
jgi:DNA-binding GntR family transcriptional regulator